jgi:hypothetical protein
VYGASGGVAFFLNRSVSFEARLNYSGTNNSGVGTSILSNTNGLVASAPKYVTVGLGFQVFFGKKQNKVQK